MQLLSKIEFRNNGEYKDVDYYIRKYSISEEKISAFNEYFKRNNYFNGDKIGIEFMEYINGKLYISYFKTNYEVAILVRNFLLNNDEIVLEDCDKRANMGLTIYTI